MNILGLNFGHDAAAAVIRDGRIASYVLRERQSRVKHAVGLEVATIDRALAESGVAPAELDAIAFTSSQAVELLIDDPKNFQVRPGILKHHRNPGALHALVSSRRIDLEDLQQAQLREWIFELPEESWVRRMWRDLYPEHRKYRPDTLPVVYPYLRGFTGLKEWAKGKPLAELCGDGACGKILADAAPSARHALHFSMTVTYRGRDIPGYFVDHHFCHAASTYYQSGLTEAAVLTHDGAGEPRGFTTGGFYYGNGHRLFPLTPHYLVIGDLYHNVGHALGLGEMGAPGKLMGLAAYGRPRFYSSAFAGNYFDIVAKAGAKNVVNGWLGHCRKIAETMGYDLSAFGRSERVLDPINVDVAASTQRLFEETLLVAAEALWNMLAGAGRTVASLCTSGGTSLNCPTNTRLFNESRFRDVRVEPACDDGGLAIGAALLLLHDLFDHPLVPRERGAAGFESYLGPPSSGSAASAPPADRLQELRARYPSLDATLPADAAADAAAMLAQDRVIGWFEGRSEAGPRALGHRSILADPRPAANWGRVNRIKGREAWRPFAPMVLEEELENWFRGAPRCTPYMLFNAQVKSSSIPAVTHVDGTARVQTVSDRDGRFHRVLREFGRVTGVPVLMNTSFNGPGEPIVESIDDAVRFFLASELDALFVDGIKLRRI